MGFGHHGRGEGAKLPHSPYGGRGPWERHGPFPFVRTLLQMQLASQIKPLCLMKNPIPWQILSGNGMNIGKA